MPYRKLLLIVLIFLLSLTIFELVARSVLSLDTRRTIYAKTRDVFTYHDNHICYDPELGFVLKPNVTYELHNLEYRILISTNSLGFRDDEESLHQPAILSIGDSFAFGSAVTDGNTVSDFLESKLGCKALNAGVPQFGTLQEVGLFKRLVSTGLASDCMTFVFFYGGNDLLTNVNRTHSKDSFRPYVECRHGRCKVINPTQQGFSEWRAQVSRGRYPALCQYSYAAYTIAEAWKLLMRGEYEEPTIRHVSFADMLNAFRFTISNFSRTAPTDVSKVVFVYIPCRKYYEESTYRKRADAEFEGIHRIMTANSFDVVDLRETLSAADYHEYDGHWKPTGHLKAATALVDFLERTGGISCLRTSVQQ